ncbi:MULTISPECIES: hypothetical protein [Brevundimonas]|jgi:hypothetical protein|nr:MULTISPECIES: hypothetical protein [Brevundimonas]|tara:strand:+ start:69092 stop:69226 length:135 start_codon:yes stop_codon:yes gene_type:complete
MIEVGLFGVGLAAGAVIAWFVKPLVAGFVAGLQASATQPTIPAE